MPLPWSAKANTLAFYITELSMAVISFMIRAPGLILVGEVKNLL